MNGKDLLTGLGYVGTRYYEEAETAQSVEAPKHIRFSRTMVIAALISLMVLLMGCAVAHILNLESLRVGEVERTRYEFDEDRNIIGQTEVTLDVISVQGMEGSPNFLAAQEWLEFSENCELPEEEFAVPPIYRPYGVYSQEMADKVDAICRKYGLKPMGEQLHMQNYQFDVLYEALGFESILLDGADFESGVGWFAECGNFKIMFSFRLNSHEADWKEPIGATLQYADKAYFDNTVMSVDSDQQRIHTLRDGSMVLIAGTGNGARILYEREDAFISVYFDAWSASGEEVVLSDRDLELIAEAIDFTIKPQMPDMEKAEKLLAEAETAHFEKLNANQPHTVKELLERLEGNLYYELADLNGDGIDEVLIGYHTDSFEYIYARVNGAYIPYTMTRIPAGSEYVDPYRGSCKSAMYLCENGVFEYCDTFTDGSVSHSYCRLGENIERDGTEDVDFVRYDGQTGKWHSLPFDTVYDEASDSYVPDERNDVISLNEATLVIEAYPRVTLEMKPINEYPGI